MKPTEQLSVITDEIGQDIEEILPTLGKYEISAVELRTIWSKNIINFSDDELQKLKAVLDENKIKVSNIAGPIFKCVVPWSRLHGIFSKKFDFNVELSRQNLEREIEIAKILDSSRIRTFGYLGKAKVTEDQWNTLVHDLTKFVDLAKQEKITVVLENEMMSPIRDMESTKRILNDIDDPYFKLILDPGNYYFAGEIHEFDFYDEILDRVGHHHIKDAKKTLGIKHFTVVGEGVLNYAEYFKYWTKKNYKGYYSLETHILTKQRERSYQCLDNMYEMLKKCNDLVD
ncbi:MAG: sugar phosphate isomerase/epimerase family protein [Candidatus Hodarchaeota archaeon]